MNSLTESYEECRRLNKYYGTPFYHAINSFPQKLLPHIDSIYAYDRIVHEMLHSPKTGIKKTKQYEAVNKLNKALLNGIKNSYSPNIYLQALIHTVKIFELPQKHFSSYSKAKVTDHKIKHYSTYNEILKSFESTSGKTSEMIAIVLNLKTTKAKKVLASFARAAHLTSLIGKLGKDYERKKRCFVAKKDMASFNYSMNEFEEHEINDNWRYLMEHYMKKIQKDLDYVENHNQSFPDHSQLALEHSVQIYNSILDSIRKKDYDVFSYQPRLSSSLKLRHMLPNLNSLFR